jgi:hypothetical protein
VPHESSFFRQKNGMDVRKDSTLGNRQNELMGYKKNSIFLGTEKMNWGTKKARPL